MFLYFVAYNLLVSKLVDNYYYIRSTYSRIIRRVSVVLYRIAEEYIQLLNDEVVYSALRRPKFRYFKGAPGTLDGTFINVVIPEERQLVQRCQKNFIAQNILAVYDFDYRFLYSLVGYEGSANDGTVVNRTFVVSRLRIPTSRYYLIDRGYLLKDKRLLVLYQYIQYYLRKQIASEAKPATKEELFNLRYTQLRNCIKRIFSIVKKRFEYVRDSLYKRRTILDQKRFLISYFVIYNYILAYSTQLLSSKLDLFKVTSGQLDNEDTSRGSDIPSNDNNNNSDKILVFRDRLAEDIQQNYYEYLEYYSRDRTGIKLEQQNFTIVLYIIGGAGIEQDTKRQYLSLSSSGIVRQVGMYSYIISRL